MMCNNAMIYNTAETIYFKAAKKLQQTGAKIMNAVCTFSLKAIFRLAYRGHTGLNGD